MHDTGACIFLLKSVTTLANFTDRFVISCGRRPSDKSASVVFGWIKNMQPRWFLVKVMKDPVLPGCFLDVLQIDCVQKEIKFSQGTS